MLEVVIDVGLGATRTEIKFDEVYGWMKRRTTTLCVGTSPRIEKRDHHLGLLKIYCSGNSRFGICRIEILWLRKSISLNSWGPLRLLLPSLSQPRSFSQTWA